MLIRHLSHGEDSRLNRCPGSVDHYRIVGCGLTANWADITGAYYDDESWEIILRNYIGRGMRFRRGVPCGIVEDGHKTLKTNIQGFAIPVCVMNRIAFEQKKLHPT
ncbi:hypothetical protein [Pseudomonas aeruginosa]|uniref:hypothetical protein n=1 Tax=Pseudomonas aeruginosa TaxID=287 RepID=UPI0020C31368|nr:hypothetical protein [Pseudomonas aeruginosa]MCT5365649.1 hypothetical protein [Pseudomonas aeruginosa]